MEDFDRSPGVRGFYVTAGVAAALFICLIVLDVAASFVAGKAPAPGSLSAIDVFGMFQSSPFRALQYLGILNVVEQVLMLTIVYAFYLAHRETYRSSSLMVLVVFILSLAIYIANNVSLPLYNLSARYAAADGPARQVLVSAGESLLARGEDFTLGSLPGFFVNEVSIFMMLIIILKARIFSRGSAIIGLIGAALLTIFTFGATFSPPMYNTLMTTSMIGGLLMVAWYVLMAARLFRMGAGAT